MAHKVIKGFLPRLQFRAMAREAYRTWLTRAIGTTKQVVNGVEYRMTVYPESCLNAVFINFETESGETKVSVQRILKAWSEV